jgi:hypothetical protein
MDAIVGCMHLREEGLLIVRNTGCYKKLTPRKIAGYLSGLLTHFFNNPKSSTYSGQFVPWHRASLSIARFCHIQRSHVSVKGSDSV